MYSKADNGEKVAMIHLFGIKHAQDIKALETNSTELAKLSGIQPAYATEISKGIKLSKYVKAIS
jgi:hypothetical protein